MYAGWNSAARIASLSKTAPGTRCASARDRVLLPVPGSPAMITIIGNTLRVRRSWTLAPCRRHWCFHAGSDHQSGSFRGFPSSILSGGFPLLGRSFPAAGAIRLTSASLYLPTLQLASGPESPPSPAKLEPGVWEQQAGQATLSDPRFPRRVLPTTEGPSDAVPRPPFAVSIDQVPSVSTLRRHF